MLHKQDVGDAHTYVAICIVGLFVTVAACVVELYAGWPMWLHVIVWFSVSLIASLYLLRLSKALFIFMQFRYNHSTFTDSHHDKP